MTNTKHIRAYPRSAFLGFDQIFDELEKVHSQANSGYPPHNVIKKSDTEYVIQVAVAGFSEKDLDIEVKDGILKVMGEILDFTPEEQPEYIHKGISSRKFTRTFRLSEHVEVNGAELHNGILVIHLEHVIPEEMRPRKISINGGQNHAKLLTES